MIKIEPLFALDYAQVRGLLKHQTAPVPPEQECTADTLIFRGLSFWQHWLPCNLHLAPSVYVAREDGIVLGLISLRSHGKSKDCWQIDHLIVHPHHRGRGIAQELLRYAFALFGGQGVSHFISEISDQNSAGLSLFGSCGFRRCSKVTHFTLDLEPGEPYRLESEPPFRLATMQDRHNLFQLHQEMLPPDIRLVLCLSPDDFIVSELHPDNTERILQRLIRRKVWYWLSEDRERRVITSAVKVTAHREGDFHLDFAVHPGWCDLTQDIVAFALNNLRMGNAAGIVRARAHDFQPGLADALKESGMEREGEFCLLAREHWVRAKEAKALKLDRGVSLPSMPNPAINLPLATERKQST